MTDIDQFFTESIDMLNADTCRQLIQRIEHSDTASTSYLINYINKMYFCDFCVPHSPTNRFDSKILSDILAYESTFPTLKDIEIAKAYFYSDHETDKVCRYMHIVSLRYLVNRPSTFSLFLEYYRPSMLVRGGVRLDIASQLVGAYPLNVAMKHLCEAYQKDKFFHILCETYGWDVNLKLREIVIRTLFSVRRLLATTHRIQDYTMLKQNIKSYIVTEFERNPYTFTSEYAKKELCKWVNILKGNTYRYYNDHLNRIWNRQNCAEPIAICDVVAYCYETRRLSQLWDILTYHLDLVGTLRASTRGCHVMYTTLGLMIADCRRDYARQQLVKVVARMFLNGISEYTNVHDFKINTYTLEGKTNSECCICLDEYLHGDYIVVCTDCNHAVHEKCAHQYIQIYSIMRCPICKLSGYVSDVRQNIGLI